VAVGFVLPPHWPFAAAYVLTLALLGPLVARASK